MVKALDLTGNVYGNLRVVERSGSDKYGQAVWLWECSCGVKFKGGVRVRRNKHLTCKSCARKLIGVQCRKYETLGDYESTYQTWRGMKERCNNPNNSHYKYYGELGIKVCEFWEHKTEGFINFYNDMGQRPEGMTLDRIDVQKGYYKENCRWADSTTQAYNTKRQHLNKSGKIGVRHEVRNGKDKWISYISYKGKMYYLGIFDSFEEACKVREEAEIKYYGVTK